MARNGSGTYSIPNSFTAGTTAEAAKVNANFTDIGSEITNSLPRDGQAAMTGQLKCASGTAAAPGMTFSSDVDTGFYRYASDVIGASVGGAHVGRITADGFTDASGVAYLTQAFPSGTLMLFQQTNAPTGWTKQTTHNDKALRVVSGTASSGGSTAFSTVFAARTLVVGNLPDFNVAVAITDPGHSHTVNDVMTGDSDGIDLSGGNNADESDSRTTTTNTTGITASGSFGSTQRGGSQTAIDFAVQYVDLIIAQKD